MTALQSGRDLEVLIGVRQEVRMMTQMVQIPDELLREADRAARDAGFSTTDEFISWAVADKVREVRQSVFDEVTNRVRQGLAERGITPEEVLEDFEQFRQT